MQNLPHHFYLKYRGGGNNIVSYKWYYIIVLGFFEKPIFRKSESKKLDSLFLLYHVFIDIYTVTDIISLNSILRFD